LARQQQAAARVFQRLLSIPMRTRRKAQALQIGREARPSRAWPRMGGSHETIEHQSVSLVIQ
ncbi:MAG: hypothetical protein ACUVS7_17740, partial [Bryobacteraceae bacterium]